MENVYTLKKKKKMRVINYHQSLKLPTGAIKLRVNLPGFPWINQELSQGQAGLGGRGLAECHLPQEAWGTTVQPQIKEPCPGSQLLSHAALCTENTTRSHISPAFLLTMLWSSISKEPRQGVVFCRVGFFQSWFNCKCVFIFLSSFRRHSVMSLWIIFLRSLDPFSSR